MQISHEAIYRSLFIQTRGVLKKELTAQLRTARRMRRPKSHNAKSGQGHILDMVSIRERPAEIEDRAVPGHWEGDLLTGANDTTSPPWSSATPASRCSSSPPQGHDDCCCCAWQANRQAA
jgi:IS30 family transposase